jgi:hypothetical protein
VHHAALWNGRTRATHSFLCHLGLLARRCDRMTAISQVQATDALAVSGRPE